MSRSALSAIAVLAAMILIEPPAQAQNQTPDSRPKSARTAEQVIDAARDTYGPPPPEPACAPQSGDEIVVCAREQDNSIYRVKSSSELDPESEEAIDDGLPRAPDVSGPGIFKGPATVGSLCIPGLQKCPAPPAYIIDFSLLPEPPEGSDADLIAKGEKKAP